MTASLKRLLLIAITLVVLPLMGLSLWSSLTEPQITDRLQLYQTDLLLHVNELNDSGPDGENLLAARKLVLGDEPLKTALEQYQDVYKSAETSFKKFQSQPDQTKAQQNLRKQQVLLDQLDLRIGLLQVAQNNPTAAQANWAKISQTATPASTEAIQANVLANLWREPPQILPEAEVTLQSLQGWFRYVGLSRLYQLQQRTDALTLLQAQEQEIAQQTLVKLALVSTVPAVGAVIGVALILGLGLRRLLRASTEKSETDWAWQVPWTWETIAWVLIVGFLFAGQIAIPGVLSLGNGLLNQAGLNITLGGVAGRTKAIYTLGYYLLMAGTGLFVLYRAVKPYSPLPEDWFRFPGKRNWVLWGLGGYFVALPLMFLVSFLNQQFWQGQGGSNPLLQIVLEEGDPVALLIFFLTAAVAAPFFEELLFRGFLLPSLTRYLPVWGAIGLSGLIFALAHLSLSEVLPLATLGVVLGFVYTRSRGLLASMLLHSLWNSVTMVGLFILGSGTT
ncbi:MAG: type II CAAX prenyl endopeptidase Rce1 family protein [Elainella sp.]